jgi:hypothetical protein
MEPHCRFSEFTECIATAVPSYFLLINQGLIRKSKAGYRQSGKA